MELLVMVAIGLSLLVSKNTLSAGVLAGSLIGIYNYILKFVSGLDTIPYTVQRLTSLNDITRRIKLEAEDFPEDNPQSAGQVRRIHIQKQLKKVI